jgi:hypothetical protein
MLDEQVIALSKAIRQHETGNRQIAGATGELASRYQFLPSTWKTEAKRILGDANAELTLENENKVAYTRIKEWKDRGYNPGQIASMWNSGNPDMYAAGNRGVGKSSKNPNVTFNVPKYVDSVYKYYQQYKPKEKTQYQKDLISGIEEKPKFFEPNANKVRFRDVFREGIDVGKSVLNYFKEKFTGAVEEKKELARREDEGEINKLAEFIGKAGVDAEIIASTVFDTVAQGIKGIGLLSEKITDTEGVMDDTKRRAVNATIDFLNTETGRSVLEIVEAGEQEWNKFEKENPSLAEIVKGGVKIAELIPTAKVGKEGVKQVGIVGKEVAAVTGEALETTGKKILRGVEREVVKEVGDIVSPKLTKKVKDIALREGRINKKGIYELSDFEKEMAQVVAPYIKKSNTPQKNISNIMAEIGRESDELYSVLKKNDAIFNSNQLRTKITQELKGVDDIMIDEKRLAKVKGEITELLINEVKTKKLSSLWDARKKFDRIIDSKLNAFAGVSTIKKDVGLAVRRAVNDFIVEKSPQLAKEGKHPFSESMAKMNKLYTAEKNIADKILPSQLNQTTLGNLGRKLSSVSHKMGAIQGAAATVGIFSLGQALFNPAVIGAILAYGSYRVGKKVITSKMLRKAIGNILEKGGKLLNPEDKKYLRLLNTELNKVTPGMTIKEVGLSTKESAIIDTFLDKMKKEGSSFENGEDFFLRMSKESREELRNNGIKSKEKIIEWFNKNVSAKTPILDNLNPTGGLNVEYTPQIRATMKLGDNITTLDKTSGESPNTIITIYRGAPKKQREIVPGDFVTTNLDLAKSYHGNGNVLSKKVKMKEVLDDIDEPLGEEYIYRP